MSVSVHAADDDAVAAGVRLVEQQLLSALEKFGVSRFRAQGAPFDPARHHALEQVETLALAAGTVATEFLPGYLSGLRLLRPALVAVSKASADKPLPNAASDENPDERGVAE